MTEVSPNQSFLTKESHARGPLHRHVNEFAGGPNLQELDIISPDASFGADHGGSVTATQTPLHIK